jgi:hypothetical protein
MAATVHDARTLCGYPQLVEVIMMRTVRRRGTAQDTVLAGVPDELQPLLLRYADNLRQGHEIRSELSTVLTRCGLRWWEIDGVVQKLAFRRS